jgi:hypothetical protein
MKRNFIKKASFSPLSSEEGPPAIAKYMKKRLKNVTPSPSDLDNIKRLSLD